MVQISLIQFELLKYQILDSLGKVIGESVETVNIQAPELSIKVEPKN